MLLFLWTKFPEAGTEGQAFFLMSTGVTQTLSQRLQTPSHVARMSLSYMLWLTVGIKWRTVTWTCTCEYQQACTQLVQLLKFRSPPVNCLFNPSVHRCWVSHFTPLKWIWSLFLDLYFSFFTFKPLIHPSILYDRGSILWSFQGESPLIRRTILSHHLCHHSTPFLQYFLYYSTDLLCLFSCNTIIIGLQWLKKCYLFHTLQLIPGHSLHTGVGCCASSRGSFTPGLEPESPDSKFLQSPRWALPVPRALAFWSASGLQSFPPGPACRESWTFTLRRGLRPRRTWIPAAFWRNPCFQTFVPAQPRAGAAGKHPSPSVPPASR